MTMRMVGLDRCLSRRPLAAAAGLILVSGLTGVACGGGSEAPPAAQTKAAGTSPEPTYAPAAAERKPGASAQHIAIPPGGTSVTIQGTLDANKDAEYVIGEEKDSIFTVHADTPERDLDVVVYRGDTGARLTDETPRNPNFFMAKLPETMGYLVVVRAIDSATPYTLEIEVPRKIVLDDKAPSVDVNASLPANGTLAYLTPPGMTVSAALTKAPADAYLTAHGLAGKVFLKAADNRRDFTGAPVANNEGLVLRIEQGASAGDVSLKVARK